MSHKRVHAERKDNEYPTDPATDAVAKLKLKPVAENACRDKTNRTRKEEKSEDPGSGVDRGEKDKMVNNSHPCPIERKHGRDEPTLPKARPPERHHRGGHSQGSQNDLHGPDTLVIPSKYLEELFSREWQLHLIGPHI